MPGFESFVKEGYADCVFGACDSYMPGLAGYGLRARRALIRRGYCRSTGWGSGSGAGIIFILTYA